MKTAGDYQDYDNREERSDKFYFDALKHSKNKPESAYLTPDL
ncbi:MAG: hypothetical protein NTY31_01155 [Candidatus Falkowbacteria bacterium]|nr:hypothetical protein [Candidatus Falkowbacteria bacterium]